MFNRSFPVRFVTTLVVLEEHALEHIGHVEGRLPGEASPTNKAEGQVLRHE